MSLKNIDKMKEPASEYILRTSREYSLYVNEQRAIPRANDGLKDSQRKALWLMRKKNDKIKTISLAGEMIASGLYLHGDASAAGAVSMLAAPYMNNYPLLNGIGNFGKRPAPDEYAAPRYTYVKKGEIAQKLLYHDLDIVPLKENYDGSAYEPKFFLPIIPLIFLNGISGIAVGWKTEILPRKLSDLVNAVTKVIAGQKLKRLSPHYNYLDVDIDYLEENSWQFTGKLTVKDTSTVYVTELPPDLSLERFRKRLDDMEEEGKIQSYEDNTTEYINLTVKFKRGFLRNWSEEKIINYLKLKSRKKEAIVCIDWEGNAIRTYDTAEQLIEEFVKWRFGYYIKRYEKYVADDSDELKYWKGLKHCFDKKLPSMLISKSSKAEVENQVATTTKSFGLSKEQIGRIASLPTYRWAQDYYQEVLNKIKELEASVKLHKGYLKNNNKIWDIFSDEVNSLKNLKYSR